MLQSTFTIITAKHKKELEARFSTAAAGVPVPVEAWQPDSIVPLSFVVADRIHVDLNRMQPAWVGRKIAIRIAAEADSLLCHPVVVNLLVSIPAGASLELVTALLEGFSTTNSAPATVRLEPGAGTLAIFVSALLVPADQAAIDQVIRPGDAVCVTGDFGAAMAGLRMMQQVVTAQEDASLLQAKLADFKNCIERYAWPVIPSGFADSVRQSGVNVSACRLVTDGLLQTIASLPSTLEIIIEKTAVPVRNDTFRAAKALSEDPFRWALEGGEDYEFVFTLPEKEVGALRSWYPEFRHIGTVSGAEGDIRILEENSSTRIYPR